MKILVSGNIILAVGDEITYGYTDETEPDIPKWKIYNKTMNSISFWIDDGFLVVENIEIPKDYTYGKYIYENGELVLNKNWKPFIPVEKRLDNAEEAIVTIEDAICETEVYSDERISAIEDALCELSTLLEI